MSRHLTYSPHSTALVLILTLTLSLIHIPMATSQDSAEIISKLRELQGDVSALSLDKDFENTHAARGQGKALMNKIDATIHQIKAGAYKGAINRLENDMKHAIEAWITETYEASLIEKVNDIIKLIKGELPSPDFSMEASPASLTIALGESDSSTITITSRNGFSELVDLMVSGVPSGVTATFDVTQVTPPPDGIETSMFKVQVDLSALLGTYTLTVTGTSGEITHSTDITLKITGLPPFPDFSIEASPTSLSIVQGDSDTVTITITSLDGFNQPVQLSVSGTPSGVTNSFNPEQVSPPADDTETSTLTVSVDISATPGIRILTVIGTSGSLQDSTDITFEITQFPPLPDFSIEANPAFLTIAQGGSDTSVITVTSINGFEDLVALTVSPAIDGVTYSLDPSTVIPPADGTITSTLTIAVAETAIPNTYVLVLAGTSGDLQNSASLSLEITASPSPPDVEPPVVRIDEPENGSYVAGLVNIVVFIYDKNFMRAELTINNMLIASWTPGNVSLQGTEHPISWDTILPKYQDDLCNITLNAEDKAGNPMKKTHIVTVDNTKPAATIDAPAEQSYLRGSVLIRVTGEDQNFYKMNLKIDNVCVKNWTTGGIQIYEWNTEVDGADGAHTITLAVYDKAGNIGEKTVKVTVDNTSPIIEATAWTPEEPWTGEQVNVTVKVTDPQPGSGVQNVTLLYKNTKTDDWQPLPMNLNLTSGNWTATIPAQYAETTVKLYIEAFDNTGSKAVTDEYEYNIIAPTGIPLAWIAAIILLILAATAAAIYFWRKRRIEKQGIKQ